MTRKLVLKEANASSKYEENFMMFLMSCCSRSFRLLRKIFAQWRWYTVKSCTILKRVFENINHKWSSHIVKQLGISVESGHRVSSKGYPIAVSPPLIWEGVPPSQFKVLLSETWYPFSDIPTGKSYMAPFRNVSSIKKYIWEGGTKNPQLLKELRVGFIKNSLEIRNFMSYMYVLF